MIAVAPTTADATAFWQGRRSDDDLLRAWGLTEQLHRQALLRQLHLFPRFTTLLEVGCGPGTNLRLVRQAFPWVRCTGVEVDPAVALFANVRLANGSNAHVRCHNLLADAPSWAPQSVDIILSCYCLAYIAPEDLRNVLARATEAARLGLVIVEPQGGVTWGVPAGLVPDLGFPEWRHDYHAIMDALLKASGRGAKLWGAKLAQPVDRCNGLFACQFTS